MKAVRLTADEEKAILDAWFETVHFDIESQGLPALKSEEDDEETRAAAIMAWFSGSYVEPIPEDIEDGDWLKVDEESIGMSRSAAKEFLERERQFQELFGYRMNPYHDKVGKFASKGGVSIGAGGATVKEGLDAQQATQLRGKLHQPDGGFTLNLHTGKEATSGFAVAVHESRSVDIPEKELTVDHLQEYVGKNGEIFADPRNMLGAWHDPNSGSVWLDVSTVVGDRDEAIALAQKHNQISIFNLDNFEIINTGGTGRSSYWQTTGRTISEERIKAYGRWRLALRDGGLLPKEFSRHANPENLFVGGFVEDEDRFNPNHSKKDGKFTSKGGGAGASMPPLEEPNVVPGYLPSVKDPVSGETFSASTGQPWQHSKDPEIRAGGLWSETYDGMLSVRQVVSNRKNGRPDMDKVDPERGWLKRQYQAVGEVQYGYNGPRLGEVIQEGNLYSKEDMGVDIRNAATVLQHKIDTAPTHRSPLYKGMKMTREGLPKVGETFSQDIGSWATKRETAEVFAYAGEVPSLGIVGDHNVVVRMVGAKRSADIGGIVAGGVMDDEHIAAGTFRVRRVTRRGKSVNIEVEQVK